LEAVEDATAREFLERELWSFRQAFASSGQNEQAEILQRVAFRAYPGSAFGRDWMFTQTAGRNPVISPVLHATFFVWLGRGIIVWFGMVLISMIWMAIYLCHTQKFSSWGKIILWLSTLFLGPVSLILAIRLGHPGTEQAQPPGWMRAWGASALTVTGYSIAWFIAIAWVISLGSSPHPLAILGLTYFLPLLVGLFFIRIPLQQAKAKPWQTFTRSLLGTVITLNLGYGVFFPLTMLISDRLLTQIPYPNNPIFWAMISFIAVVGTIILTPLQYWMIQRGCCIPSGLVIHETGNGTTLPRFRTTWPALLATFVMMVAALVITIMQLN